MATKYVNGVGKPRFEIRNVGSTNAIELIDLPMTLQPNGLREEWWQQTLRAMVISPSLSNYTQRTLVRNLGWNVSFSFDYEVWMVKENIMLLKKILDYSGFGYEIWLIPRVEYLSRKFKVILSEDTTITIQNLEGGIESVGNRSITFTFENAELLPAIDIRDPDQADWCTSFRHLRKVTFGQGETI